MKLRIRGNSLRLRLTQAEVARIKDGARIEEAIAFGPEPHQQLIYALESSTNAACVEADYRDGRITVRVPQSMAREWACNSEQIGISGEQFRQRDGLSGDTLKLLIEKDFACLTEHRGADDADTFPHPMEGTLSC